MAKGSAKSLPLSYIENGGKSLSGKLMNLSIWLTCFSFLVGRRGATEGLLEEVAEIEFILKAAERSRYILRLSCVHRIGCRNLVRYGNPIKMDAL